MWVFLIEREQLSVCVCVLEQRDPNTNLCAVFLFSRQENEKVRGTGPEQSVCVFESPRRSRSSKKRRAPNKTKRGVESGWEVRNGKKNESESFSQFQLERWTVHIVFTSVTKPKNTKKKIVIYTIFFVELASFFLIVSNSPSFSLFVFESVPFRGI